MQVRESEGRFFPGIMRLWAVLLFAVGLRQIYVGTQEEGWSLWLNVPVGLMFLVTASGLWAERGWARHALTLVLVFAMLPWLGWFFFDFIKDAGRGPFWLPLVAGVAVFASILATLMLLYREMASRSGSRSRITNDDKELAAYPSKSGS